MLYDPKRDPAVQRALALVRIGCYDAAREELVAAYGKAYLYGHPSHGRRILQAITFLTWKVQRDIRAGEQVYQSLYELILG